MAEVARVYPGKRQQPEPLWREVLGSRLRALRGERGETLADLTTQVTRDLRSGPVALAMAA